MQSVPWVEGCISCLQQGMSYSEHRSHVSTTCLVSLDDSPEYFLFRNSSFLHYFVCSGFFLFCSTWMSCCVSSSGSSTVRVSLTKHHIQIADICAASLPSLCVVASQLIYFFSWLAASFFMSGEENWFCKCFFLTFSSAYCSRCLKEAGEVLRSTAACTEVIWAPGSACLCAASPLQQLRHSWVQAV